MIDPVISAFLGFYGEGGHFRASFEDRLARLSDVLLSAMQSGGWQVCSGDRERS